MSARYTVLVIQGPRYQVILRRTMALEHFSPGRVHLDRYYSGERANDIDYNIVGKNHCTLL